MTIKCPLCGQYHIPKFYIFVSRTVLYAEGKKKRIRVVRIICHASYEIKKQYTLTILPLFLVPYSIIHIDLIIQAVNSYISGKVTSYQAAAFLMHCENTSSFILYYRRVIKKLPQWIKYLSNALVSHFPEKLEIPELKMDSEKNKQKGEIKNPPAKPAASLWQGLLIKSKIYIDRLDKKATKIKTDISYYFQRMHPVFFYQNFGLGP